MPSGLYGFRPKTRPQYQSTDAVTNPVDPRIPRPHGQPPVPQAPVSESQPYHSGVSAENDSESGPGTTLSGDTAVEPNAASYASQQEALAYNQAGLQNGYFGTVQDAARASQLGNQRATGTLQGFLASGPTGRVNAPGTLGFLGTQLGNALHGGPRYDNRNITDSLSSLSASGDLYNNENSSGYFGDSLHEQQTVSDVDAANTFGTFGSEPTLQQLQGPEIFHDAQDTQATQVAEQQANYDHYQDNSSAVGW